MENRADQLIESFFANSLSKEEAAELKALAASNPEVAQEIAFQQKIASSLQSRSLARGIQNKEWANAAQAPAQTTAIRTSMWPRYYLAAAAAIALLVAAFLFLQSPNLETVVADNTAVYLNNMKFKSLGDAAQAVPANVIEAFDFYDQGAYEKAAKALQPLVALEPERMEYRFYWGVALVQSKQYSAAIEALTPVVQTQQDKRIPAHYYLGLAYAATGNKNAAREHLQMYANDPEGVSFKKQALTVLKVLDAN